MVDAKELQRVVRRIVSFFLVDKLNQKVIKYKSYFM